MFILEYKQVFQIALERHTHCKEVTGSKLITLPHPSEKIHVLQKRSPEIKTLSLQNLGWHNCI